MHDRSSKYLKIVFLLVCLFTGSFCLSAQTETGEPDTTDNIMEDQAGKEYAPTYSYSVHSLLPTLHENVWVDTTLFQPYNEDVTLFSKNLYARMNCFGQAGFTMNFTSVQNHGFTYKTLPYTDYLRTFDNWTLYEPDPVYVNLAYSFTNGKENHFSVTYAQKIYDNLKFNFIMESVVGVGRYLRQSQRNVNVGANISYLTPNSRYGFSVYYILNFLKLQENGGIANNAHFEDKDSAMTTLSIPVRLPQADNRLLKNDILLRHYLSLASGKRLDDKRWGGGYIVHDFSLTTYKNRFTDNTLNTGMYRDIFIDSTRTNDPVKYAEYANRLFWSSFMPDDTLPDKKNFIHFAAGAQYSFIRFKDTFSLFKDHQLMPLANLQVKLFNTLNIQAKAFFTVMGYNAGDITVESSVGLDFLRKEKPKHSLIFKLNFYNHSPDYFFTHLTANNFSWDNSLLKKQQTLIASAAWLHKGFEVGVNYFGLVNYIVLNNNSRPSQTSQYINVYQLSVFAPFHIKGFGMQTQAYLQYADNDAVRIPYFAGRQTIYYGFNLFKKALYLQFGLDFSYNTSYYANAYNPALQQFYLQNEKKVGNYGYLDFYLQTKIGRFVGQAKMTHLWGGAFGKKYYLIPHYPARDMGFAVGISWRFYD